MNGALYISFFEGQLESTLEQVVQLAVREITGTVGASLGSMLLETARKEQENQRLRASIQARKPADKKRTESGGAEPERSEQHTAERSSQPISLSDSLHMEQKRRAVGELKLVMERVLEFAVCELSKIVEDSFDDVLLELRKTEQEHEELKEKLQNTVEENRDSDLEMEKKGNETDGSREDSPRGSADKAKDEKRLDGEERGTEQNSRMEQNLNDSASKAVIGVSQDWVPVLNKVFGQKWCNDVWPVKEASTIKPEPVQLSSGDYQEDQTPLKSDDGQLDQPKWLHDTEVVGFDVQQTSISSAVGDYSGLKSPSMLHRLLTLPTQLLDDDDESMESEDSLINAVISSHMAQKAQMEKADDNNTEEDRKCEERHGQEEEEEEQETKLASLKGGRKVHPCKVCGKKFNRAHLLKTHRQTHKETVPSSFSKLHTHVRTNSGKTT